MMASSMKPAALAALLLVSLQPAFAYDRDACCLQALGQSAFLNSLENPICGQNYNRSLPPAQPLFVDYRYCVTNCDVAGPGGEGPWVPTTVQFILPAVIFSMIIPRRKKIEFKYMFDWRTTVAGDRMWINEWLRLLRSMGLFLVILVPVVVDTVVWILVIVAGAGNMLVGGLYEALIDYRVLRHLENMRFRLREEEIRAKKELLITILSGNLRETSPPFQKTMLDMLDDSDAQDPLTGHDSSLSRLLNLLDAQTTFGSVVGSPVLFYLVAFIYTTLDLRNDPTGQGLTDNLAFGIEWMILVNVAIVSGCLLASNNPNATSATVGSDHQVLSLDELGSVYRVPRGAPDTSRWSRFSHRFLGWSDMYTTTVQPVSLWSRGKNKYRCLQITNAWSTDAALRQALDMGKLAWIFSIFVPAFFLAILPSATAGLLSFLTPPRGLGCRSVSFVVYAGCQIIITLIATISNVVARGELKGSWAKLFSVRGVRIMTTPFWLGSLFGTVGATAMVFSGEYNDCYCAAGAGAWLNPWNVNPWINLARDTAEERNTSVYWVAIGITASVFMALTCYVAWWYQRLIRYRFIEVVKAIHRAEICRANGVGLDFSPAPAIQMRIESASLESQMSGAIEKDKVVESPVRRHNRGMIRSHS